VGSSKAAISSNSQGPQNPQGPQIPRQSTQKSTTPGDDSGSGSDYTPEVDIQDTNELLQFRYHFKRCYKLYSKEFKTCIEKLNLEQLPENLHSTNLIDHLSPSVYQFLHNEIENVVLRNVSSGNLSVTTHLGYPDEIISHQQINSTPGDDPGRFVVSLPTLVTTDTELKAKFIHEASLQYYRVKNSFDVTINKLIRGTKSTDFIKVEINISLKNNFSSFLTDKIPRFVLSEIGEKSGSIYWCFRGDFIQLPQLTLINTESREVLDYNLTTGAKSDEPLNLLNSYITNKDYHSGTSITQLNDPLSQKQKEVDDKIAINDPLNQNQKEVDVETLNKDILYKQEIGTDLKKPILIFDSTKRYLMELPRTKESVASH
jgi:hypothetical protein